MASKGPAVKVTFTGDTSDLDKKLDKLEKEVAGTSREIDTITSSSDKASTGLKNVRDRANDAGDRFFALSDVLNGTSSIMSGLASGNFLQVGIGLAEMARGVADLSADFVEWGKKAWEAGGEVVKAHLASIAAKAQDIAAMVAHRVATIASTVATEAWAAAQWLLNAAIAASPIVIAIAVLAALAVGLYEVYQHVGWFHDAVDKAWQIIQQTFDWIKEHWPLILVILTGPIGLAVVEIVKHFDAIRDKFVYLYNLFVNTADSLYNAIKGPFEKAFSWVKAIYDKTIGPIISALKDVKGMFGGDIDQQAAIYAREEVKRRAQAAGMSPEEIAQILDSMPLPLQSGAGKVGGTVGDLYPGFASGGLVKARPGGTIVRLGEAGQDEWVVPANKMGGGGNTYNIVVHAIDPRSAADSVVAALQEFENSNGFVPIRRIATTG